MSTVSKTIKQLELNMLPDRAKRQKLLRKMNSCFLEPIFDHLWQPGIKYFSQLFDLSKC